MSISILGRPKASNLPDLIKEGQQRDSPWKCKYCSRSFLRKKNLTTHERTHTAEKPYRCNYPGCEDEFKQSGQLRTHERCHTGEKPFACRVSGCTQRFAHSNRKCSVHSEYRLIRDGKEEVQMDDNMTDEVLQWLKDYKIKKENPAKRKKFSKSEGAVKQKSPSPEPSTSSGVSSSSAQEEERIPDEAQAGERQLQMPVDSEVIEAARILCSFTSGDRKYTIDRKATAQIITSSRCN